MMNLKKGKTAVLITGARGFIGKNLSKVLSENKNFHCICFHRNQDIDTLRKYVEKSNVIVHLAAEIKSHDETNFQKTNIELTRILCNFVSNTKRDIPIIFASSILVEQSEVHKNYSKSKLEAEKILINFSKKFNNPISILRLPSVFGKWAKPNYNSVTSTFCNNIANDLPICVDDPSTKLYLLYVDDLVQQIVNIIDTSNFKQIFTKIKSIHEIYLGDLANIIKSFKTGRGELYVEEVGVSFTRKIYATYLSYLPKRKFSYMIPKYEDERGIFSEIVKTKTSGQFSFFTCKPGITRGKHYHHTKSEKFLVVYGKARFWFKHVITNEKYEIVTTQEKPTIVDSIPGWAHNITNIGESDLIVMVWANEVFDKKNPDTVGYEI